MTKWLILGTAVVLFACGGQKEANTANEVKTIELVPQLNSLTKLKASDYFDKIEYVALETTDSSLIGRDPKVSLLSSGDILVSSNHRSLLFDRQGRFLRSIGHRGNDPEGFQFADGWEKGNSGILYFPGWKNTFMKYTTEGKCLGTTSYASKGSPLTPSYLNNDTLVGYFPNMMGGEQRRLLFFNDTSDSLALLLNLQQAPSFEIDNISVIKGENAVKTYGKYAQSGVLVINGREGLSSVIYMNAPVIWHRGKETYFKEEYNDTIYRIQGTELIPRYIFNTGEYQWPYAERYNPTLAEEKIGIQQVMEGGRYLFFNLTFHKKALLGIFDKETGATTLSEASDLITDDLTGFMPLNLLAAAPSGEFISYQDVPDLLEWFDENEEKASSLSSKVASLKKLKEDDNPVVIIIHPKK